MKKIVELRMRLVMEQHIFTPTNLDDLFDVLLIHAYDTGEVVGVAVSPLPGGPLKTFVPADYFDRLENELDAESPPDTQSGEQG